MSKEAKLLVAAVVVALFSLVMFSAAAFFYDNLQQIFGACAEFGLDRAQCYAVDSVPVSVASVRSGIAWFSLIGLAAWMIAVYVGIKSKQAFALNRLP